MTNAKNTQMSKCQNLDTRLWKHFLVNDGAFYTFTIHLVQNNAERLENNENDRQNNEKE